MTATHIHIFYTDAANGWCEQTRDSSGNEVGAAYHYRKSDAKSSAKETGLPIHVFGKNGLFQHTT